MTRKLKEPCMDPNPWDPPFSGALTHDFDRPRSRPKGHDNKGGGGANWGNGHAEHPSDEDPPTKRVVLHRYWEAENPAPVLKIRYPDDDTLKVTLDGKEVAHADHDANGWEGMKATEQTVRAIAKALNVKVDPT